METTETGKGSCFGAEVLDGRAHFGGNGLLLDEEEVGFDELCLLGLLVFGEERSVELIRVVVFSLESCGGRSLDHGKGSYDITVRIGDLLVIISLLVIILKRCVARRLTIESTAK